MLETNIHFPTDLNLLWDSSRKCIETLAKGIGHGLSGWRKHKLWKKDLKNHYRKASRTSRGGGANKAERVNRDVGAYLDLCRRLETKVVVAMLEIGQIADLTCMAASQSLKYYHRMLKKHIDLVERRLIKGEQIPHEEKVFSIFEPHTEWISKGKLHRPVELGRNILIATDQFHFILHHHVTKRTADVQLTTRLADHLLKVYGPLRSISFDRGFYSKPNKEYLKKHIPIVCLPKKGNKTKSETEEEADETFVRLRRKHSAVESNIHQLECNGLNRCPDKGEEHFRRYAALGVLSYNLHRLGSHLLKKRRKKQQKARKVVA